MIKKTITYKNVFGNEITEDFYFHLTEAELLDFDAEFAEHGGFTGIAARLAKDDAEEISDINRPLLFKTFKALISKSYGIREGDKFYKDSITSERFLSSEPYSKLFLSLMQGDESAGEFMTGILPDNADVQNAAQTARERSEARMQGFNKKQEKDPEVITRTAEPKLEPQEQAGPTQEELIAAWQAQQNQ